MSDYKRFLEEKTGYRGSEGIKATFLPDYLFDFQAHLVETALANGRYALFEDCGLGKTIQQLVWGQNVIEHTNKPVLLLTPLAVAEQTASEAERFSIDAEHSREGKYTGKRVIITNYEQLKHYSQHDFGGVICDESSILKSFDGKTKTAITEFMKHIKFRLLATATAAPNDYTELGTSSEALGGLGYMDMLNRFFKNDLNNSATGRMYGEAVKWRFKGHSEVPFWRWVCSWSRAIRKPSDIGFDDSRFVLPELIEREHVIETDHIPDGFLFSVPAVGLKEQREERKSTIEERCNKIAELCDHGKQALVWAHLNDETDYLEKIIPGAVQVSGKHSDKLKADRLSGFAKGDFRVLVTKPKIGAWGLNYQNCDHVLFFPSHSYEKYYQGVRRCWRFGQKNNVTADVVTTEGEIKVLENMRRKAAQSDEMFRRLVEEMNASEMIERKSEYTNQIEVPKWA